MPKILCHFIIIIVGILNIAPAEVVKCGSVSIAIGQVNAQIIFLEREGASGGVEVNPRLLGEVITFFPAFFVNAGRILQIKFAPINVIYWNVGIFFF